MITSGLTPHWPAPVSPAAPKTARAAVYPPAPAPASYDPQQPLLTPPARYQSASGDRLPANVPTPPPATVDAPAAARPWGTAAGKLWNGLTNAVSSLKPSASASATQAAAKPMAPTVSPAPADVLSRSPREIVQSMTSGAHQAIQDLTRNASTMMGLGGAMVGASAICPFAGGALAATGVAGMSNHP